MATLCPAAFAGKGALLSPAAAAIPGKRCPVMSAAGDQLHAAPFDMNRQAIAVPFQFVRTLVPVRKEKPYPPYQLKHQPAKP